MEKFLDKKDLVSFAVAVPEVKPLKSAFLTTKVIEGKQGWDEYIVKKKYLPDGKKHGKQYEKKRRDSTVIGFSASFRNGVPHGKFWLKKKTCSLSCVSGVFKQGKLEFLEIQTKRMKTVKILYEDGVPGLCYFGDSAPFRMYDREKNLFYTSEGKKPLSKLRGSSQWDKYVSFNAPIEAGKCETITRREDIHDLLLRLTRKFSVVYGGLCLVIPKKHSMFGVVGKDKQGRKCKILVPFSADHKFPKEPCHFKHSRNWGP